jgi:hypothetical protein
LLTANRPIHLNGIDPLEPKFGVQLNNVVLNEIPKFSRPQLFDPAKDSLNLALFNIQWESNSTGFLGADIGIEGKLEGVGFSRVYVGNFNIQGSKETKSSGVTAYATTNTHTYEGDQHAKNPAVHKLSLEIEKGDIVSVELMHPVFKVWKIENGAYHVAFTGDHQTLCVLDAELKR